MPRDVLIHGWTIHLHAIPGVLVMAAIFYLCFTVIRCIRVEI